MTLLASWVFWLVVLVALAGTGIITWIMVMVSKVVFSVCLHIPIEAEPFRNEEGILQYSVNLKTHDGVSVKGFFIPGKDSKGRAVVFCHEIGAGAASYQKYAQFLLEKGFNVFTFDFRGHGLSGNVKGYTPRQWATNLEENDLKAALDYLKTRRDVDPQRIGLFGISKGGSLALVTAARRKRVKAIVTDGAFSTTFTLDDYARKWTSIYLPVDTLPGSLYWLLRVWALWILSKKIKCHFSSVEKAVKHLQGTALLLIHGEKDSYISFQQAQRLFELARTQDKELWIVPQARHNEAVVITPWEYQNRIAEFFEKHL